MYIQGLVRTAAGKLAEFDVPGSHQGGLGTRPFGITKSGTVTGQYYDANVKSHGFLRDISGNFTIFDVPRSEATGTFPLASSPAGAITGYFNSAVPAHPFIRDPSGSVFVFGVPGADATFGMAINDSQE